MAITISGSGITSANILDGTIVNADINSSAAIAGTKVDGSFGKVLQVVSITKTDTWSASLATGATSGDVTGLTPSITPSSTSSKILITYSIPVSSQTLGRLGTVLCVGGSEIADAKGDAGVNQRRMTTAASLVNTWAMEQMTFSFLHSPASTSSQTYSVRIPSSNNSTVNYYVNRTNDDDNQTYIGRAAATMTLMEIGA